VAPRHSPARIGSRSISWPAGITDRPSAQVDTTDTHRCYGEIVESSGLQSVLLNAVDLASLVIEVLAVAIIVGAIAYASVLYLLRRGVAEAYTAYRVRLGRALLLGLEVLVAADIIRTVALQPTLANVVVLGLLVLIRTFLSWSLVVEIDGRWPWQRPTTESRPAQP
jgi:uncharacterized membrane protein